MRTLAITQNITLDGAIEMIGDWFDPTADNLGDVNAQMKREDAESDAVLLGRRTFEDFRGFWPKQVDDTTGVTDQLNAVRKYVVSNTLTDPEWENSVILSGDILDGIRALKEEPGEDIIVTGSITLCHALIEAGLVDQYRLFHYPVVQGRGRRLFPDGYEIPQLELLESLTFRSGITYSRYAPVQAPASSE